MVEDESGPSRKLLIGMMDDLESFEGSDTIYYKNTVVNNVWLQVYLFFSLFFLVTKTNKTSKCKQINII